MEIGWQGFDFPFVAEQSVNLADKLKYVMNFIQYVY